MPTKLILGLTEFNKGNKQLWTVPRKGTAPHSNLLKIMGREDLAKRQDEYRHNQIIKRQEELSRLEHNLGVVVKVNKIRKFLGTAKEKIAEKKKKKNEVPSVAEQVLFNPDLLRMIGGYKKDLEYKDKIEEAIGDLYFPEYSDDSNDVYSDTWIEKLTEDLIAKKNPAKSEKIGSFYIYGGEGSQTGALYDMVKRIHNKLDFPFEINLTATRIDDDVTAIRKYFDRYLEYSEQHYQDREEADEEEDEDEDEDEEEEEDGIIEEIRRQRPEVLQMIIKYEDNKGRLGAIEFLKVLGSVIEKKIDSK
jgi:hypothetical protein